MKKVLAILVGIIIGVVLTVTGYNDWRDSKKLVAEGKSVIAQVTHHYDYKPRRGTRRYYLVVGFETESKQAQSHKVRVGSSIYRRGIASGTVQVHYLPSNPEVVQAGEKAEVKYAGLVGGLVILAFSLGTCLFYVVAAKVMAKGVNTLGKDRGKVITITHQDVAKEHATQQKAA